MSGWPLLGHLVAFRADSPGFLLRQARRQGDVARFRLGRREAFLLAHPDQVRAVLVDHADRFEKGRLMQRARRLLGNGLLTSEGVFHTSQRRRIRPVFTQERLHAFSQLVPPLVTRHIDRWQDGARIRVDRNMNTLTMRVIARTLLGADIEDEAPFLERALRRLARWAPLLVAPGGRFLERTRLPLLGRLRAAIETVEAAIDRRIATGGSDGALVDVLLQGADSSGEGAMSARLVRDEVMTAFLAGHDTTAAALTWIWLLLAAHPAVEARLHDELTAQVGGRPPDSSDVARLPYTDGVVREALRLYPPISRIGRRPIVDVDLGGIVLPRGATVFVSPFVTQRDPRWFSDPARFRPERWAVPDPARPRFAWFPFGAGPRACIGEHLARGALVLAVATIAQRVRLRPTARQLPRGRSLLTLKPRGAVWMVVETRRPCGDPTETTWRGFPASG